MPDTPNPPALAAVHHRVAGQLRAAGQRYTDGRRRLVTVLVAAGRPVSLPELLELDPALPQSSTYRSLEALEATGMVRRIPTGTDHTRYELAEALLGHHHHLICDGCGSVEDILLPQYLEVAVEAALEQAAESAGFAADHHTVDLHGLCPSCA